MNPMITSRAVLTVRHDRAVLDPQTGLTTLERGKEETVGNILTDAGRVALHTYIYGTAAQRVSASLGADGMSYIGLSNSGTTPSAADTSLAGELSSDGLARAQGTVTLPTGSGTITSISHEFTYSGGVSQGVQKTALFDAATGGNMVHEILFTQRTLDPGDVLTLTFNITLS